MVLTGPSEDLSQEGQTSISELQKKMAREGYLHERSENSDHELDFLLRAL
jgi:hypothetical protein